MAAKMERTAHPGIYKRGSRYVVVYRVGGRQKKEAARTLKEAQKLKAARQTDIDRGEFDGRSQLTFRKYAEEWVERYQGRGGRGFRESTRDDYRRSLQNYAFPYFDEQLRRRKLSQVTPRDLANFIRWLCDPRVQAAHALDLARRREIEQAKKDGRRPRQPRRSEEKLLSDSTVRNIVNPIRACYATAVQEGVVRFNPTQGIALPHRPSIDEDDVEEVRALTREQLKALLEQSPPPYRTLFRLLAATGLRISEAIALEWRHLALEGARPHVKVRRAIVRCRVGPPKTKRGRRDVPLDQALVSELSRRRAESEWPGDEHLVFPSLAGTPLQPGNVRRRALAPLVEEVGAPWAGFHTFRHTCASMLFERGANPKQVQRWLGHHSPSFTMDTYVHLLSDELDEPLTLAEELGGWQRNWQPDQPEAGRNDAADALLDQPSEAAFARPTETGLTPG